jgi:hypothetical protein
MQVRIELTGTTPLMMHNERLIDPENEFNQQIKAITGKKTNQTEEDKKVVAKLEWYGGLYADESGNVVIPTGNIIKCVRDGAAVKKAGMTVLRGIAPHALSAPLINGGDRHKDKLWGNPIHRDRRSVGIGRSKVMRTRPIFPKWAVTADFELLEDVLNFDELKAHVENAGRSIGLGDARIKGYGRFTANVTKRK